MVASRPLASLQRMCTVGLLSIVMINVGMLAADAIAALSGHSLGLTPTLLGFLRLVLLSLTLFVITLTAAEAVMIATTIAALILNTVFAVVLSELRHQPETAIVAAVATAMGAAVLIPWGTRPQAALTLALTATVLAGELATPDSTYPRMLAILGIACMISTVYLAREMRRTRVQLAERVAEGSEAVEETLRLHAQLEEQIRLRTTSLQTAEQDLEDLCQSASHDLRPPLRTIAGFSQILGESARAQGRPTDQKHLKQIIELAQSMGLRIDDLLTTVRRTHRDLSERLVGLISLTDIAHSERMRVHEALPDCQWVIEDAVVAETATAAVGDMLRAILDYLAQLDRRPSFQKIEFATLQQDRQRTYCVTARGHNFDANTREELSVAMQGILTFKATATPVSNLVTASRELTTIHGGRAWIESGSTHEIHFLFQGPPALQQEDAA